MRLRRREPQAVAAPSRQRRSAGLPLAIGLLLALCGGTASAQDSLYAAPSGFWLLPSDGSKRLYGESRPDANWNVSQWDIPEDLPAFVDGRAANRFASAAVGPNLSYRLSQDGGGMPCLKRFPSGRALVDEFDLFASPNDADVPGFPQARRRDGGSLAAMADLRVAIRLRVDGFRALDGACRLNQSGLIVAVVVSNAASGQALFYQIRLAEFRAGADGAEQAAQPNGWFAAGTDQQSGRRGMYGFGEDASALGDGYPGLGVDHAFDLDILPRLRRLIAEGAALGLDPDLRRWRVSGTYHGIRSFGHVVVAATWGGFSLTVELRADR